MIPGLVFIVLICLASLLLLRPAPDTKALAPPNAIFRRQNKVQVPRPPRFHSRRKPDWVREEIIRLHHANETGCRVLATDFNRLYAMTHRMTVGKTFVRGVLRAYEAERANVQETFRNRVPEPVEKNHTWGLDFTGKQDSTGNTHYILGLIDHGSRFMPRLCRVPDKSATTVLALLGDTVAQYGKPDVIRTDNEAVFRCATFREGLKKLGIRPQYTQKNKPWQNGRIERLFLTLKEKLDLMAVTDFTDLDSTLTAFCFWYNRVRPHQHLNGLTPEEAWLGIDPWQIPYKRALPFSEWGGLLKGYYLIR